MDGSCPISVNEQVQLNRFGISNEDVTWSRVTMTNDSMVSVRQHANSKGQNNEQINVIKLSNPPYVWTFPFPAEFAVVNPFLKANVGQLLAYKVGDQLSVEKLDDSSGQWYRLRSTILTDVQFWTWISSNTIGLVTDRAVFHWLIEEAELPCKVFTRHQRLDYAEITSYKCDPSGFWCALTGLIPQVESIVGETQLYSVEKRVTQCICIHAVLLTEHLFDGNQLASTVLCAAGRDIVNPSLLKVHVVEFGSNGKENLAPWSHCDAIEFNDSADRYDFPVSLQVSTSIGLLYVVTKYSQLFLCDLETSTCVYSVALSSSITFATALNSVTQGILVVNTAGQILSVDVNLDQLVKLIQGNPSKKNISARLRKQSPLIPMHFLV